MSGFEVEPFYFGTAERRLFGIYHAAQRSPARSTGIVLCGPIGHEYVRTHRAFRNLAAQLARLGFPVLRFDYSSCGDSAGEAADARLADWSGDLSTAIDELRRTAGVGRVVLVGLRLGGALAAVTAAPRRDVSAVVLWDPVVSGASYLKQLERLNQRWLIGRGDGSRGPGGGGDEWVVGLPMSDAIRREIAALNLAALDPKDFPRVLLFVSDQRYVDPAWAEGIRRLYGQSAYSIVSPAADWDEPETVHTALLPQPLLQAIASAIGGLAA